MLVTLTFNQGVDSNDINTVAKAIESIISVITSAEPATAPVDASVISEVAVSDTTPTVWYAHGSRRRGNTGEDLPADEPVQVGDHWSIRNSDYPNPEKSLFIQIMEKVGQNWPTKYQILVGSTPFSVDNRFIIESKPAQAVKISTGEDYIAFLASRGLSHIVRL